MLFASVVKDTLYLNAGQRTVDQQVFPMWSINHHPQFDSLDAFLRLQAGDTLLLTCVNQTTQQQEIQIEGLGSVVVAPGNSGSLTLSPSAGVYRIAASDSMSRYLGLTSILLVSARPRGHFLWNLRDQQVVVNQSIAAGQGWGAGSYVPDVFTINSLTYPYTTTDSMAMVMGKVGDTLMIHMLNSGMMVHPIHFHGYHVQIMSSNLQNKQIGWMKDTFPIRPGELMTVRLVPHQPGKYPVHNHNLVAVTRGGNYPGGMMAMLHIMP